MICKNSTIKTNNNLVVITTMKICNKKLRKLIKRLNRKWIQNKKVFIFFYFYLEIEQEHSAKKVESRELLHNGNEME